MTFKCDRLKTFDKNELPNFLDEAHGTGLDLVIEETLGFSMANFMSDPVFRNEIQNHFFRNDNVENACDNLIESLHLLMLTTTKKLIDGDVRYSYPKLKEAMCNICAFTNHNAQWATKNSTNDTQPCSTC